MENAARISIDLHQGMLEVSGSEEFVREQIKSFEKLIQKEFRSAPPTPVAPSEQRESVLPSEPPTTEGKQPQAPDRYPNVIAFDGDNIQILKSSRRKTTAAKMVEMSLLHLLAKSIKGEDSASFDELQKVCKDHKCLDAGNFASTMRGAKEKFIVEGTKGGNLTAKLTHPGRTAAESLAKELNGE